MFITSHLPQHEEKEYGQTDRRKVKNILPPTMIVMGKLNELFHLPNNTVTSFSPITNCRDISYENIYVVSMSTVTMGGGGGGGGW